MKKKLFIVGALVLTFITCLLVVPTKKASALSKFGVECMTLDKYIRLNTPSILFIDKNESVEIELRLNSEENLCYIQFSSHYGEVDIYHDCSDDNHYKIYETENLFIIDFLISDYFPIDSVECSGLEYVYITFDRNIIPIPLIDKLYKYYLSVYDFSNDITIISYDEFILLDDTTKEHKFKQLVHNIGLIEYNNGLSSGGGFTEEDLQNKFDEGFLAGVDSVELPNTDDYFNQGYDKGKQDGINIGRAEGEKVNASFSDMILSVLDAPRQAISNMLNFEFLGINLSSLVFFLISSALVFAIVKFFI